MGFSLAIFWNLGRSRCREVDVVSMWLRTLGWSESGDVGSSRE